MVPDEAREHVAAARSVLLRVQRPLGALEAAFPRGSKAKHAPRVLLKIEAAGNAYECHETKRKGMASKWTGKVAVTRFRVSRIMTDGRFRSPRSIRSGSGRTTS